MEKILFISPSTPCKTTLATTLSVMIFCTLFLGWLAYIIPETFLVMVITIVFCWGCLVVTYISTAHKFILTDTHFVIKRYLKDSAIPLQNIKSIRHITRKQFYMKYAFSAWTGGFGSYPTKIKSVIAYNRRWDNWALIVTDKGKFLISPNDMQLIDATLQQIEKVKDGEVNSETIATSKTWHKWIHVSVFAAVTFFLYTGYREPRIIFDNDAFKLKGRYGVNIPLAQIAEADTIAWHEMPAAPLRTNGIALFKVRRGNFRTKDGDKIRLSIYCGISPVIRIIDRNGAVYYINRKNAVETRQIFNELQKR